MTRHLDRSSRVSRIKSIPIDAAAFYDTDGHFQFAPSSLADVEFTERLQMSTGDGTFDSMTRHLDRSSRASRMNDTRMDRAKSYNSDGHVFITQSSK
jgi:hypothetical protein